MGHPNEQIGRDRRIINAAWHAIKKATSRLRRRQAKRDPENAPTRGFRGWVA